MENEIKEKNIYTFFFIFENLRNFISHLWKWMRNSTETSENTEESMKNWKNLRKIIKPKKKQKV